MRHLVAHIATIVIAMLLLGGAALWAWIRSAQLVITTDRAVLASYMPAAEQGFAWHVIGGDSYLRNCMNCHRRDGSGWDQYPPLDRVARIMAAEGGRDYLIDLHLHGLASPRWRAPMPSMGHLQNIELAAILNHVLTRFGEQPLAETDPRLYRPEDITARRALNRSPRDVARDRPGLD